MNEHATAPASLRRDPIGSGAWPDIAELLPDAAGPLMAARHLGRVDVSGQSGPGSSFPTTSPVAQSPMATP